MLGCIRLISQLLSYELVFSTIILGFIYSYYTLNLSQLFTFACSLISSKQYTRMYRLESLFNSSSSSSPSRRTKLSCNKLLIHNFGSLSDLRSFVDVQRSQQAVDVQYQPLGRNHCIIGSCNKSSSTAFFARLPSHRISKVNLTKYIDGYIDILKELNSDVSHVHVDIKLIGSIYFIILFVHSKDPCNSDKKFSFLHRMSLDFITGYSIINLSEFTDLFKDVLHNGTTCQQQKLVSFIMFSETLSFAFLLEMESLS